MADAGASPQGATPGAGSPAVSPPTPAPSSPQGGTLSRELGDFLVELSIAFHKHAIYPQGHPLLGTAVDQIVARLWALLEGRSTLSIGIARRQLIIEGVATDPNHPLLHELASKLHRHHLGALRFSKGITRDELSTALATLAVDAGRMERPLGLDADAVNAPWVHVRVFPLTYERLELLDEDPGDEDDSAAPAGEGQMRAGRAAQLWVGLARAALAADAATEAQPEEQSLEPVVVAKAIDEHHREVAYDQVIVGYLLQIAEELKTSKNTEAVALQRRISGMVGALKPETLGRLLEMSGDNRQRRRFVLDASQGMTLEAVLELVKAAADAEQQTISHSLMRMFGKMAQHATDVDETRRHMADASLREQVVKLIREWTLDDPNPEAYRMVLEEIARRAPTENVEPPFSLVCEPERIVKMGLEVGVVGVRVEAAIGAMLDRSETAELLDLVDAAPDRAVAAGVWQEIEAHDTLREVLAAERLDVKLATRLVNRMRLAAILPLLDAVEATEAGKARDRLLDLLASIGDDAGPYIAARLATAPANLQRDLLVLLSRLTTVPQGLDPELYLMHPENAVRREAVKLFLKASATRQRTMLTALSDPDNRTVFLALSAAMDGCPPEGLTIIRQRVDSGELDPSLRALGIRVVGGMQHDESTRHWLVDRVVYRTKWLRRKKLMDPTAEMLAALSALAVYWKEDRDAQAAVQIAYASDNAEVRQAVVQPRVTGTMRVVS